MTQQKKQRSKILKTILSILVVVIVLISAAFFIYLSRYSSGDDTALNLISNPSKGVTAVEEEDIIAFVPSGGVKTGVIFYPGAKIRANAYTSLANSLAENGFLCVLVNMPLNLASLDSNSALSVRNRWPEVQSWYIAGHSMGGTAAENCAFENPGAFEGLIVLASRISYDFSASDLPVLAVYASNDGICSTQILEDAKKEIPEPKNYTELMIDGGCHGYFGNYGPQFMDGTPTISRENQQTQTVNAILKFISGNCEELTHR